MANPVYRAEGVGGGGGRHSNKQPGIYFPVSGIERHVEHIKVVVDTDMAYGDRSKFDFNGYNLAKTSLGKALGLDMATAESAVFVVPYDGMDLSTHIRVEALREQYGGKVAIVTVNPDGVSVMQNPGVQIPQDNYLFAAAREHMPTFRKPSELDMMMNFE